MLKKIFGAALLTVGHFEQHQNKNTRDFHPQKPAIQAQFP